jgi:hypothetical protein
LKLGKLGIWSVILALSLPVFAADRTGAISGYVRNASGTPQMGAIVEILGAANHSFVVFTDASGHYAAPELLPGFYTVKVTAPSFLPSLREKVGLNPGAHLNVNITLSTLLDVMQLGPMRPVPDDDDWKWTLRSVANRPVLRVFGGSAVSPEGKKNDELSGTVSFVAGSTAEGYGSASDMSTSFSLEHSMFSDGQLALSGNVGYGDTLPSAVLRASFLSHLQDGSEPELGMTVRRFSPTDPSLHNAALQSLAMSANDDFVLGDVLELRFGSELQAIQFLGHLNAFRPHGTADFHLSPNAVVEYGYTTSRPDETAEKGFDSTSADMSESNPRVSLLGFSPRLESAHHQELSISERAGDTNFQVAVYADRIADPALTGAGEVTAAGGFLLPDISSETFTYTGRDLNTAGLRVVLQHKFSSDLTATLDYAYGGVLDLAHSDIPPQNISLQSVQQYMSADHRHAIAAKLSGTLARTHTRWIASYRWVNGSALTPVDMFNASAGQSAPYLNIFIRQPMPCLGGHMEAIIDVRNLLAQGYVPVVGQDGQTVYLVDSARSVRGGVAFNF